MKKLILLTGALLLVVADAMFVASCSSDDDELSNSSGCTYLNGNSWYGKFDVSWTGNGNDTIQRRLNYWLDHQGTWERF